jgi:hypothetical protein
MIVLSEQQRRQLSGHETEVLDPETQETYILVRRPVYERLRSLLDDDIRASGELVDKIMAADDANDPHLESYQSITRENQS